ncbi:hypothetical protein [Atlantibacter hermannii]|uniref:hypothetical protein n=1 Tax=Atlantibacter hermannii TaxID=565 RepID=UPI0028AA92DE|nr:hypothetical protein [Atlantibacter hermannii]
MWMEAYQMTDNFDDDIERQQLLNMSDVKLKEQAVSLGLLNENDSIENMSTEDYSELLSDIIKEQAEDNAFQEMYDEEQDHYEQLRLNDRFSD